LVKVFNPTANRGGFVFRVIPVRFTVPNVLPADPTTWRVWLGKLHLAESNPAILSNKFAEFEWPVLVEI